MSEKYNQGQKTRRWWVGVSEEGIDGNKGDETWLIFIVGGYVREQRKSEGY
jgi:hypothetical protein